MSQIAQQAKELSEKYPELREKLIETIAQHDLDKLIKQKKNRLSMQKIEDEFDYDDDVGSCGAPNPNVPPKMPYMGGGGGGSANRSTCSTRNIGGSCGTTQRQNSSTC